jgi:hypothetical protein
MAYIDEDWNSVPTGPNNAPDGWDLSFGSGVVFPFSAGGQYPSDNFYQFNAGNLYSPIIPDAPTKVSLFWGFNVSQGSINAGGVIFNALNAAATGILPILELRSEGNNSFTLLDGGANIIFNSSYPVDYDSFVVSVDPSYIYQQGIWNYAQLNVEFQSVADSHTGVPYVKAIYDLAVNSVGLFSGEVQTAIRVDSLFGIGVFQLQFPGALTGFLSLSRIVLEDQVGMGDFPQPAPTVNGQIIQEVVEWGGVPNDSSAVAMQLVVESASFPLVSSSVDVSQMVIEVAYFPILGTGWVVSEA